MTRTLHTLIAGAALLGPVFAHTAFAEESYPRSIGTGENTEIDYGPGPRGNVVGGGRVIATGNGEDAHIQHLEPQYAQAPRRNMMPVTVGSGENSSIVWVPADTSPARLALIGPDGSLPAETDPGRGLLARLFGNVSGRG